MANVVPKAGGTLGWKIVGGLAGVAAGLAARKVVAATWRMTTGKEPPEKPESPTTSWREAVGWSVVSGTTVALARLVATRKAAAAWARSTGSLPPPLEASTRAAA